MFRYDTKHLSPNSARTAVEGLRSTFIVEDIKPFEDGRERYYAFRMKKPIAVRVGPPILRADYPSCPSKPLLWRLKKAKSNSEVMN